MRYATSKVCCNWQMAVQGAALRRVPSPRHGWLTWIAGLLTCVGCATAWPRWVRSAKGPVCAGSAG